MVVISIPDASQLRGHAHACSSRRGKSNTAGKHERQIGVNEHCPYAFLHPDRLGIHKLVDPEMSCSRMLPLCSAQAPRTRRQANDEFTPCSRTAAVRAHRATVEFNDPLHDVQPDTEARLRSRYRRSTLGKQIEHV